MNKSLPEIIKDFMDENGYKNTCALAVSAGFNKSYRNVILKFLAGKSPQDFKSSRKFLAFIGIPEGEIESYISKANWRYNATGRPKNSMRVRDNLDICPACGRQTLWNGVCVAIEKQPCNYGFDKTTGLIEGNAARGFKDRTINGSTSFRKGRS